MKIGDIVWLADTVHNVYAYKLRPAAGGWTYTYKDKKTHDYISNREIIQISLSDTDGPSRSVLVLDTKPTVRAGFDSVGALYAECVVVLYGESMIMLNVSMLKPLPLNF